jgi:hypothetical protein
MAIGIGSKKLVGGVLVGAVLVVLSLFFMFSGKETIPTIDAMVRTLATDTRADGVLASNVVITKETEQFVRGTLVDERDGTTKTFFAMKVGDLWRIVDVTASAVSCERFARLGFPEDFIVDCVLSFSDAVTVAEIDATFDAGLLVGTRLQVIGFVTDVTTEGDNSLVTVTSGGATDTFTVATGTVNTGDVVVITVEELAGINQGSVGSSPQTTSTQTRVVTQVVTVGDDDDELVTSNTVSTQLPQETVVSTNSGGPANTTPVTGVNGTTIYKINAPNTAPPRQQFFNVYDIDRSFEDIKIEGSF